MCEGLAREESVGTGQAGSPAEEESAGLCGCEGRRQDPHAEVGHCLPQPGREGDGEAAAQVSNKVLRPGKPHWSLSITQSLALLLPALAVGATGVTSARVCVCAREHTHTHTSALLCLLTSSISLEPKLKVALNLSFSLVATDNQIEFEKPQERLMWGQTPIWPTL